MHFESTIIPLVAIIMIFGMPIFIVAIVFTFINRSHADKQKTLRLAIEKGEGVPAEVLEALQKKVKSPMRDVRLGIILIAVAAGLVLWQYIEHGHIGGKLSGFAAVPGLIGVAFLLLGII